MSGNLRRGTTPFYGMRARLTGCGNYQLAIPAAGAIKPRFMPIFGSEDPFSSSKRNGSPSLSHRRRFWNQCQHGSWYFLPWHRIYLGFFEQIVRSHVVALGGPDDWALPYWNYSDERENPNARLVRPEFLDESLPDGSPNSLAQAERGPTSGASGDFGVSSPRIPT